jgi:ABC-type uncharacterized transport system permease subunit
MTQYYDLVLGLIPVAFGAIAAVLFALGFAVTTAVPAASVVAIGLVGHAMFVNGPVDRDAESAAGDTSYQTAD